MTITLNQIHDNKARSTDRKRIGRGIGSGKGKTSGHGHKGQKARSGVSVNGFEGGQNPIYRRLPKRGFNNIHAESSYVLTTDRLAEIAKKGILSGNTLSLTQLEEAKIIKSGKFDSLVIINKGKIAEKMALMITARRISASAKQMLEKAGCTIEVTE